MATSTGAGGNTCRAKPKASEWHVGPSAGAGEHPQPSPHDPYSFALPGPCHLSIPALDLGDQHSCLQSRGTEKLQLRGQGLASEV